ncbi:helix-turn-helix domain-containing protein [Micromonospora zhanjiangensis]
MLADRLGRSKSWVDKVERGVRRLDKFSMIRSIAEVLRVDTSVLLSDQGAGTRSTDALGLAALRAALACHHVGERETPDPLPAGEPGRSVGHAWSAYQHAHYPQLVRMLPNLLGHLRRTPVIAGSTAGAGVFVQAYRITASVLVKLGEADLAWLAADRAMAAAGEDRLLAAVAAIPSARRCAPLTTADWRWQPPSPPRIGSRRRHPTRDRLRNFRCSGRCWPRRPCPPPPAATRAASGNCSTRLPGSRYGLASGPTGTGPDSGRPPSRRPGRPRRSNWATVGRRSAGTSGSSRVAR